MFNADEDTQIKLREDIRTACRVLAQSQVNFMDTDVNETVQLPPDMSDSNE